MIRGALCCTYLLFAAVLVAFVAWWAPRDPRFVPDGRFVADFEASPGRFESTMGAIAEMLHLDPHVGHRAFNHTHDPCQSPFEYACDLRGEESVQETARRENEELMDRVTAREVVGHPFFESCVQFMETRGSSVAVLAADPDVRGRMHSLAACARLEQSADGLHRCMLPLVNLREPLAAHLDNDGRIAVEWDEEAAGLNTVGAARLISDLMQRTRYVRAPHTTIANALSIHRAMQRPDDEHDGLVPLGKLPAAEQHVVRTLFPEQRLNGSEVYANRADLRRYMRARRGFHRGQWQDYFAFVGLKTLLHQLMVLMPADVPSKVLCWRRFKELFPLRFCHWIKDHVHANTGQLQRLVDGLMREWQRWMHEQNPLGLDSGQQLKLRAHLDRLVVYLNQCTVGNALLHRTRRHFAETNQRLFKLEVALLNASSANYVEWVGRVYATPELAMRRHSGLQVYYRGLVDRWMRWNAWYDDQLHAVIVPAGMLNFVSRHLAIGSPQLHAMAGMVFFHEIFHGIYAHLRVALPGTIAPMQQCLSRLYDDDGRRWKSDVEENAADHAGLKVAFEYWSRLARRSPDDKRSFLLSFVRLWCHQQAKADGMHALGIQRAMHTMRALGGEWGRAFGCGAVLEGHPCL